MACAIMYTYVINAGNEHLQYHNKFSSNADNDFIVRNAPSGMIYLPFNLDKEMNEFGDNSRAELSSTIQISIVQIVYG